MSHVEVDEKSHTLIGQPQIGEELRKVNRQNLLNRLDLHDHNICNQQVDSIAGVDVKTVVNNGKQELSPHAQARSGELVFETGLVDAFE
jgi:hypothetical protein